MQEDCLNPLDFPIHIWKTNFFSQWKKEIFRFCATKEIIKPNLTKSDKEKVHIHCKKKKSADLILERNEYKILGTKTEVK